MLISVVNHTKIPDAEVQTAIRAINRQIEEDFFAYWSFGGSLRLEGRTGRSPNSKALRELRGNAVLYLWDQVDVQDALGYHEKNAAGIPYGFVFTDLSKALGEAWTVTLSHEALELIGDPEGNLLVQGPHPVERGRKVFHWFEMCDAVQSSTYLVDGVSVANFLLPLYFTTEHETGSRNDFLGIRDKDDRPLRSFGVSSGSYVGFYDPQTGTHDTYSKPRDTVAETRKLIKSENRFGRGYMRLHVDSLGRRESVHKEALSNGLQGAAAPIAK